jgi:hypothetical protein
MVMETAAVFLLAGSGCAANPISDNQSHRRCRSGFRRPGSAATVTIAPSHLYAPRAPAPRSRHPSFCRSSVSLRGQGADSRHKVALTGKSVGLGARTRAEIEAQQHL